MPFSTINNVSISVKRSNFRLVLSKAACHAGSDAVRKRAGSSSYIQETYFLSSQPLVREKWNNCFKLRKVL